jgi:hypothetical protein
MKSLLHFMGLAWDVTAAGVIHYWTLLIVPTIDSSIKWLELG